MSTALFVVRCRNCGQQADRQLPVEQHQVEADEPCPNCGAQPFQFDVLGQVDLLPLPQGEQPSPPAQQGELEQQPPAGEYLKITPAAWRLALDNSLDPTGVAPTGAEGQIVVQDIEDALMKRALERLKGE